MARTGLTDQVRKAARELKVFRAVDLYDALAAEIREYADHRRIREAIKYLRRQGEARIIERGLYEYTPKKKPRTKLDVIWHLARSRRHFSTADIERLSGAKNTTAREYLQCLVKYGFLIKTSLTTWKLVNDPGPETPVNTAKCQRLKKIRERNGSRDPATN